MYTEPSTEWSHGLCEAYALLDSAYYLSQLVSIFFVQTLLQFTKSPVSYTASSAIFGCLGIFAATQVILKILKLLLKLFKKGHLRSTGFSDPVNIARNGQGSDGSLILIT